MDPVYRYFATLYASRSVADYSNECRTVVTKLTGSAAVPNPTPTLVVVTAHLDALDAATKAAIKGPKGSAAARNAAQFVVRGDMRQLKACVQVAADANIANSKAIIEGSGMYATRRATNPKPDLAAKYGPISGTLGIIARAIRRSKKGSYGWQMSTDMKTWTDLAPTTDAKTTVTGLTAGTLYYFRYRTFTKAGYSDWSVPIEIIAH
jgi:hypothetical protein